VSAQTRQLFLAVSLPAVLARRLAELVPAGPGARLVPPNGLHLTLQFLGDVAKTTIRHLTVSLDGVRAAPFAVALTDRGRFPPAGRRRCPGSDFATNRPCGRCIPTAAGPCRPLAWCRKQVPSSHT